MSARRNSIKMSDFYSQQNSSAGHDIATMLGYRFFQAFVLPKIREGAENNVFKDLTIADIGSVNGFTFRRIYNQMKEDLPCSGQVILSDLNDHTREIEATFKDKDLPVSFKQGDFYDQIFDTDSLDVFFSAVCFHWSKSADMFKTESQSKEKSAEFLEASARHYQEIIDARYAEVKSGGYVILTQLSEDSQMTKSFQTTRVMEQLAVEEGIDLRLSFHIRSQEQQMAPFLDAGKWEVVHNQIVLIPCPNYHKFLAANLAGEDFFDKGVLEKYGKNMAKAVRTWSNSCVESAYVRKFGKEAAIEDIQEAVDAYYEKLAQRVMKDAHNGRFDFEVNYLIARKV